MFPSLNFSIKDDQNNEYSYTITSVEDQTEYVFKIRNVLDSSKKIFRPEKVYKIEIYIKFDALPKFWVQKFLY